MQHRHALLLAAFGFAPLAHASSLPQAPPASQWHEIHIHEEEEFYNHEWDQSAATGDSKYYRVDIPAGMKRLRIETIGANGNADLIVTNGSPSNAIECSRYSAGSNERCEIADPAAGTRYIQVRATEGFDGLRVVVANLPPFEQISDLQDSWLPYTIGRREAWWTRPMDVDACLHVSYPLIGYSLPKQQCMAIGNQQVWYLQEGDNREFRLVGQHGARCLTAGSKNENDVLQDQACRHDDPTQRWTLHGGGGATHYVAMKNLASNFCAKLDDARGVVVQAQCKLDEVDTSPAWNLMDIGRRFGATQSGDRLPSLELVAGNHCLADDGTSLFLAECTDKARTHRMLVPFPTDWHDWWDGAFEIRDAAGTRCVDIEQRPDDSLHPVLRTCDGVVATQRWKLETADNHAHEWQLHNVGKRECLMPVGGAQTAGTPLVLGACSPVAKTNKWKYRRD